MSQSEKPVAKKRVSAAGRQDGEYTPPIVTEPTGGPVPDASKETAKGG